ncbi:MULTISPECIES: TIGR04255 family protein [Acinetobacter calcoaceticus/baumannii complex]|uniref:TIGR04255 family protein n=1 Tax=Acinetobacter calcoaceticus/baumannii complex TaxID=909768 RepID=UPI00234092E5|nr:TIGR04255 family protein [Acinetobacter baumannii]MDC5353533.1 TIGR04255 family protein [Acinetobacter baumannii]MDK2220596.1 TIGR04255 family protein [Acinetobacter baumannii]MDK2231457.1 TIGR04255 family protein [Acinetobacter baumannii]HCQ9866001.1 TIGR04255 family protein [Acinetobacter baumannii]
MKKSLEKAPLVHVLLDLRFSESPALKNIPADLEKTLHEKMMDIGFPEKILSNTQHNEIQINQDTNEFKYNVTDVKRLLFRAAGEQSIVEFSSSAVLLKATQHSNFEDLSKKFMQVVEVLENIFSIKKTLLKSLELRYVDVIVPVESYTLSDFFTSNLNIFKNLNKFQHELGQIVKVVRTEDNQKLIVNFVELPCIGKQIHQVLPNDLIEQDPKCSLIIKGDDSWLKVESATYGLLDIKHIHNFIGSPEFNLTTVKLTAKSLYNDLSDVFWDSLSDIAKKTWGYEEK